MATVSSTIASRPLAIAGWRSSIAPAAVSPCRTRTKASGSPSTARVIYNYRDLRPELEAKAATASCTVSDTETIVHAWEEYGPACVDRLEGMFAFAIYDKRRSELFMARDRLGKKPLFYTVLDGVLHFASELQALARVVLVRIRRSISARSKATSHSATSWRRRRSIATSTNCCPDTGCTSPTAASRHGSTGTSRSSKPDTSAGRTTH